MRKQLAFAGILALLMGTGAIISNPVHAQQQVLDPQTGQQPIEPGEATGLLTNVDEVGGFIEVDGILYQVGEGDRSGRPQPRPAGDRPLRAVRYAGDAAGDGDHGRRRLGLDCSSPSQGRCQHPALAHSRLWN
jgi:hypothetical protein